MNEQIYFERNFHVSLEDRFLMAKYGGFFEIKIGETRQETWDRAEKETIEQFCRKHPHMAFEFQQTGFSYTNEPIQQKDYEWREGRTRFQDFPSEAILPVSTIQKEKPPEDVTLATIKEIMDCTDLKELKTFEIWAKANNAEKTYKAKLKELS